MVNIIAIIRYIYCLKSFERFQKNVQIGYKIMKLQFSGFFTESAFYVTHFIMQKYAAGNYFLYMTFSIHMSPRGPSEPMVFYLIF